LGGIWTGHAKGNTMSKKKRAGLRIVELPAVVALNVLDGEAELRVNICKEVRKSRKSFGF
jgi:hypothetical protein